MVEYPVRAVIVRVGSTDETDDGEILAVRSGYGVQHAQTADREGNDASPDSARSGVAFSGVAGVKLVAAADEIELRLGDELVEKSEVEVSGNGEDVADAKLHETARYVAAEIGF